MSVTQSFTITSDGSQQPSEIKNNEKFIINQTKTDQGQTITVEADAPVVVLVPFQQQTATETSTIWQKIQSIAFVLILIVVVLTIVRTAMSFFNNTAQSTAQAEMAAAATLATELEAAT